MYINGLEYYKIKSSIRQCGHFEKEIGKLSFLISCFKKRNTWNFLLKLYLCTTTPLYKNTELSLNFISYIDNFMSRVRSPDDFDIYNFCGDLSFLREFKYQLKILYIVVKFLCTTTKLFLRPQMDKPCVGIYFSRFLGFWTEMGRFFRPKNEKNIAYNY